MLSSASCRARPRITRHDYPEPDDWRSAWVGGHGPSAGFELVPPDPAWPAAYERLARRVQSALGGRVLSLDHVGSTAVPGLAAQARDRHRPHGRRPGRGGRLAAGPRACRVRAHHPRAVVARTSDARDRDALLPAPCVRADRAGTDSATSCSGDWLRTHPDDLALYQATKLAAAEASNAAGEHGVDYNRRKQAVIREIYDRAFRAAGLL